MVNKEDCEVKKMDTHHVQLRQMIHAKKHLWWNRGAGIGEEMHPSIKLREKGGIKKKSGGKKKKWRLAIFFLENSYTTTPSHFLSRFEPRGNIGTKIYARSKRRCQHPHRNQGSLSFNYIPKEFVMGSVSE